MRMILSSVLVSTLGLLACEAGTGEPSGVREPDAYRVLEAEGAPVILQVPDTAGSLAAGAIGPQSVMAGELDPTFGNSGLILEGFPGFDSINPLDMLVRPDGYIIAVVDLSDDGQDYVGLVRYTPDGAIDGAFANGAGFQLSPVSAWQAALQSDNKIVVLFEHDSGFGLVRYTANGLIDTSFGLGGFVYQNLPVNDNAGEMIAQPYDDKIVVAIHASGGDVIMRFTANGFLDTSFGSNGSATLQFTGDGVESLSVIDLTIQPDGKILAVGVADDYMALARLTAYGAIDTSFGSQGRRLVSTLGYHDLAHTAVVQLDGKIVVVGSSYYAPAQTWYATILRLNANGTAYDTSFGESGPGQTYVGFGAGDYYLPAVALQADGKIVVAGLFDDFSAGGDSVMIRLDRDGTLDGSFLGGGAFRLDLGDNDATLDVAIQANGKILAGGWSYLGAGGIALRISRHQGTSLYPSCNAILEAEPDSPSGVYSIDPDDANGEKPPFEVYCDMIPGVGGFTLIARTDQQRSLGLQSWRDILAQNFFGTTTFVTSTSVPSGYLGTYPFFAILGAAADIPFQEVMLFDGYDHYILSAAGARTLRQIHASDGVEPLYSGGVNTGVLLLLGNANHQSSFPCYYPNVNGSGCSRYFTGDSGSQSTAFYVGTLEDCQTSNLAAALWGSADCHGQNTHGGYGGFTYHRPIHGTSPGYANSGYDGAGWAIYLR